MTTREIIDGAEKIDLDTLLAAVESEAFGLENPGFCLSCGAERDGCEPDAREYPCDECGKRAVFGAAEVLLYVAC